MSKGNPYHVPSGPHGGEFTHGPNSAQAKTTEKQHTPETYDEMRARIHRQNAAADARYEAVHGKTSGYNSIGSSSLADRRRSERINHRFSSNIGGNSANYRKPGF